MLRLRISKDQIVARPAVKASYPAHLEKNVFCQDVRALMSFVGPEQQGQVFRGLS